MALWPTGSFSQEQTKFIEERVDPGLGWPGLGEEEEKGESSATRASSFKDLFLDWDGPDLVFNNVSDWIHDFEGHSKK